MKQDRRIDTLRRLFPHLTIADLKQGVSELDRLVKQEHEKRKGRLQ